MIENHASDQSFSAGELQRLGLARSLLKMIVRLSEGSDSSMCLQVFDEPTSHLDRETEAIVCKNIFQSPSLKNQITVVATHSDHALGQCKRFLYVDSNHTVNEVDSYAGLKKLQNSIVK